MANFKELLHSVKAFVFDVDGVFSNGNVYLHPSGEMMRTMSVKDGFAVHFANKKGYPICIITGGFSESVKIRFNRLGIEDVFLKSKNKLDDFNSFIEKYDLKASEIMYMGDDMPDYPVMSKVGVPVCPADAIPEIQNISKYISPRNGGNECVRDVIEQVLRAQDNWFNLNEL